MKKIIISIFLLTLICTTSNAKDLDRDAIIKRLEEGQVCLGMFFEAHFSELLANNIINTHYYGMYHSKAMDIIRKPMDVVMKELKKSKQKIKKDEWKKITSFAKEGKKIVYDYLKEDKFNKGESNMVPLFEEGGNNKTGFIAKENTEPREMTDCKKKFLMDEDELLTFGIMSTKVKKAYIKQIAEKYRNGF